MKNYSKKEDRILRMPEKFADMTEEEAEYGGGTGWAAAAWFFGGCTFASAAGAAVTGYLWYDTGSSEMKNICICFTVAAVTFGVLTGVSFGVNRCVSPRVTQNSAPRVSDPNSMYSYDSQGNHILS